MLSWKKAVAVVGGVLALFVVVALVVTRNESAAEPRLTAQEQAFYDAVTANTDLGTRPVEVVVKAGHDICANIGIPGVDRMRVLALIQAGRWSVPNSVALLSSAETKLCPERHYALPVVVPTTVAVAPTVAPTTEPPVPAGPAKVINVDATYEVGVEIAAGKWKSGGGAGTCYWARLKADADREIIDNELGGEGDTVWIRAGELFKVQDCGTWTWVSDK